MSLELAFVHPVYPTRTVGPLDGFRIDRDALRAGPAGEVLARHVHNRWEIENVKYFRLECAARFIVSFEGSEKAPSRAFGPYRRFSAMDGLAYTDDKVFAIFDPRVAAWLCYDLGEHYPVMAVAAAPAAVRRAPDAA